MKVDWRAIARVVGLGVIVLIPIRVVEQGWLPPDDALRHAAKAVSGREWSEVLVLRPEAVMDSHPGWHALLGLVHRATGAGAPALVLFSVVGLFVLFSLAPLLLLRRPEAWLVALFALAVADREVLVRLFMGRPYELSSALLVAVLLLLPRLDSERAPRALLLVLALAFGFGAWAFPSWYLFAFPVAAFFLAGRWRAGGRVLLAFAAGVCLAALATGHPVQFVTQSLLHPLMVFGVATSPADLVNELQPFPGGPAFAFLLLSLLLLRAVRGRWTARPVLDPALLLAGMGFVAGFAATRFWVDWGVPAGLAWASVEIEDALEQMKSEDARVRLSWIVAPAVALFLATTADIGGRWSRRDSPYLPLLAHEAASALPDPGGILYTDDINLFFPLFYRRPDAPWRYMVGFEPGWMPADDRAVLKAIQRERTPSAFVPWVRKMRREDRLVLRASPAPPVIPGMAWQAVGPNLWSGRLAGEGEDPTAAVIPSSPK
jgi:hypothetical protein